MWLSGIKSDGEKWKDGGEVKRGTFQWIHYWFYGYVQTLDRCHGQYGMDILDPLNLYPH